MGYNSEFLTRIKRHILVKTFHRRCYIWMLLERKEETSDPPHFKNRFGVFPWYVTCPNDDKGVTVLRTLAEEVVCSRSVEETDCESVTCATGITALAMIFSARRRPLLLWGGKETVLGLRKDKARKQTQNNAARNRPHIPSENQKDKKIGSSC